MLIFVVLFFFFFFMIYISWFLFFNLGFKKPSIVTQDLIDLTKKEKAFSALIDLTEIVFSLKL